MLFNVMLNNFDRSDWGWLADTVNFLTFGIEEAGHHCQIGGNVAVSNGINLFLQVIPTELVTSLKANRLPFAFICTELITDGGEVGWGWEAEAVQHAESVAASCRESRFVWSLLPGSLGFCRRHNRNSYYWPFGYVEAMRWPTRRPPAERDIDFLISGFLTDHRREVGAALAQRGYGVAYTGFPTPDYVRNDMLARTKFQLAVKKSGRHELISPTRLCHSLINDVPLIAEYDGPADDPYFDLCFAHPSAGFVERCIQIHQTISPVDSAQHFVGLLRQRFDFRAITAHLIETSLAEAAEAGR